MGCVFWVPLGTLVGNMDVIKVGALVVIGMFVGVSQGFVDG